MPHAFLDKLTIIIFSYNRQKYLKRTIKYWSNYNVKLLVLDGSDTKLEDSCLNTKNIKYIYDPRGLYKRLLSSIDYIDTEFMILGCDDEFYLPSALSTCINFLIKESSFSSCKGRAIGFGTRNKGKEIFGKEQYPKLRNLCLDHNNASERISKHFSNYVPAHLFSVMKSNKWQIICKYVFEKEYNFTGVWELQIEFLVMVSGKSKVIPELMWMRNLEVAPIRGTSPSMSYKVRIRNWWYQKKFRKEKEDFLNKMKKACDEFSNDQNFEFTKNVIEKLFEIYIHAPFRVNLFRYNVNIIINKIKKLIKTTLYSVNIITNKDKVLLEEIRLLEEQCVSVNYKDLDQVISALQYSKSEN